MLARGREGCQIAGGRHVHVGHPERRETGIVTDGKVERLAAAGVEGLLKCAINVTARAATGDRRRRGRSLLPRAGRTWSTRNHAAAGRFGSQRGAMSQLLPKKEGQ